ncbi:pyruvate, water dikinase [Gordonia westfalica]|uniref:Pyruvate, water dikinase n=2 Tax=Gordonia westfalica TaxID=158898 RepID=A0A1H2KKF0_9ACTN|nr:pyruvate, water dikinase [Gordonia westfalica]
MDVLNAQSPPGASWSSINLAEAVPGVMTPLTASVWVPASEMGLRSPFHAMGVLTGSDAGIPDDPLERITGAFFGRMAVRVDFLCRMGDLIPGQSGDALARDFFGFVPEDFVSSPSMRRLPAIAVSYPRMLATIVRRMRRDRSDIDAWWRQSIATIGTLGQDQVRSLLTEAVERFTHALELQAIVSAGAIQPVQEQITTLAERAGVDITDLLRGHGSHEESVVLADMWNVSRGEISLAEFLLRHGYHCAGEGETASTSWREDPAPVERLIASFAGMPDSESPQERAAALERAGAAAERTLFAGSGVGRMRTRLTLRLARLFIPLRGVGKVSYLQSLDVIRACARRLGADAVTDGVLDTPDDAFYLTAEELARALPDGVRSIVADRRARRLEYQSLKLPAAWVGNPEPERTPEPDAESGPAGTILSGVGASPGTVEGRAVVVTEPADAEVSDGDILIAHTTDPSWVSLMFLSEALVVDIGGMMSHAAVVAREMGVPCVMNTRTGTTTLTTGDRIRVDGASGTVEILVKAAEPRAEPVAAES